MELGAMKYPGDELVAACGRIASDELGWDAGRTEREAAAIRSFYR
jgi:hypothetical protein